MGDIKARLIAVTSWPRYGGGRREARGQIPESGYRAGVQGGS